MGYKKLNEHNKSEQNPFLDTLFEQKLKKKKVRKVGPADQLLINRNTGSVEGHTAIMAEKECDEEQFVKIFIDKIGKLWDLSKAGQKVFAYIATNLKPNVDVITIYPQYHKEEIGYKSKAPVLSGISELIEKEFIARSQIPYSYFINPQIFFNGSRISFIESYVKKNTSNDYEKNKDIKGKENNANKELPNSGESGE